MRVLSKEQEKLVRDLNIIARGDDMLVYRALRQHKYHAASLKEVIAYIKEHRKRSTVMLLIDDDPSLDILKGCYTFSNKKAEEDWDWSIQLLKRLSEARKEQGTHLEARIEVFTGQEDDESVCWEALAWSWAIGSDWHQRAHMPSATIDGVNHISYYAGVKDHISHNPTIVVNWLKNDQDRETVTKAALGTLNP